MHELGKDPPPSSTGWVGSGRIKSVRPGSNWIWVSRTSPIGPKLTSLLILNRFWNGHRGSRKWLKLGCEQRALTTATLNRRPVSSCVFPPKKTQQRNQTNKRKHKQTSTDLVLAQTTSKLVLPAMRRGSIRPSQAQTIRLRIAREEDIHT